MNLIDRLNGLSEGLAIKVPARVATTGDISLYGLQTIDDVAVAEGDRVLVWQQADAKQNGIYDASSGPWQRSKDFDGARDIVQGTTVIVNLGTVNAQLAFWVTSADPQRIGTTDITLAEGLNITLIKEIRDQILGSVPNAFPATMAALKAIDTTINTSAFLKAEGLEGQFIWRTGNYADLIAADTGEWNFVKADAIAATSGAWVRVLSGSIFDPLIIFVSGQSNVAIEEPLATNPPANLFKWNWLGDDETTVGTKFLPASRSLVGLGLSYATEIANAFVGRPVFLINIGRGAQPIAQWMTGAATPDLYACCKQNVEAALAYLGATKVDRFLWWQGESDDGSATYPADFETVIARFRGETWFPYETPIVIMGVSPYYFTNENGLNDTLAHCAERDPQRRTYISQRDTKIIDYWMPPSGIHMTGLGYQLAGKLAYLGGERGIGQKRKYRDRIATVKRSVTSRANTSTTTADPDLKIWLRTRCRIRIEVWGETNTTPGFKWGITGPSGSAVYWKSNSIYGGSGAEVGGGVGAGYPTNQSIASVAGAFFLEIEIFHSGPTSPHDYLSFTWAQNTSNAATTYVYATSEISMIEG